jgi:NAD(P)-dependent dehydrogenase (short-subunit alcohol dehydrogenase family)
MISGKIFRRDIAVYLLWRFFLLSLQWPADMSEKLFSGKVALVTGAGKRIGRSIALRLAAEGASVAVNYSKSEAEAEDVAAEINTTGGRAAPIQADVSRRPDVEELFAAVDKEFGRLDILVNNAGIFFPAKFEELTDEQWDRIQNTNLKSQFLCAQAAVPMMRRSGGGHIVNISSLGAFLPWPSYTHYCVSKAGSVMLTKCLAVALGPEILVNSIAPGTITFPGEPPHENFIQRAPLHKTGTGEDIADAVVYLASSRFVTGQVIAVDGGRMLV